MHQAQIERKYFPALDGLRVICVALVIFTHVQRTDWLAMVPGWVGVDIFFVISGFLITTLLLREENKNGRIDVKSFYIRRFFRIVPLYAVILAFYIVQARFNPARWALELHSLPYQLTFMNDVLASKIDRLGLATDPAVFGAAWSLGIEEKFYLVWPTLFLLLPSRRLRAWIIPLLVLAAAFLPFRMFRSYFGLLAGCAIGLLLASRAQGSARRWFERVPVAVMVVALVCAMGLIAVYGERFVFLFTVFAAWLVVLLMTTDGWLVGLLSSRPMVWLGQRSYSMYLCQAIALSLVERIVKPTDIPHQFVVLLCGFAVATLIAAVLYRWIESPTRAYGKWMLARSGHTASSITPIITPQAE